MSAAAHELRRNAGRLSCSVLVAVLFAVAACSSARAEDVSTLAGSGRTGNEDGTARAASFSLPMGFASDLVGNVLVADGAGQRIRVVRKDGRVETLAGGGDPIAGGVWVPGGYADGDAKTARFNRPAGIAVAEDGTVFVADTYNNCIRRISPAGLVSTWIGAPDRTHVSAGPRATAQLAAPVALAIDRAQHLYALTQDGSLAAIDPAGTVTIVRRYGVPWEPSPVWSLAISETANLRTLFVGDGAGLYVLDSRGPQKYFRGDYAAVRCLELQYRKQAQCTQPAAETVGKKNVGAPSAIAALSDHLVVYTDASTNSVRMLDTDTGTMRQLIGTGAEDRSASSAGYRDGDAASARIDTPTALARSPGGRLVLGDAGNRRIRVIAGIDAHQAVLGSHLSSFSPKPGERVIAYAGDASIWPGEPWNATVEGRLEAALSATHVRVVPVVLTVERGNLLASFAKLLDDRTHRFDAVIVEVSPDAVARYVGSSAGVTGRDSAWRSALASLFLRARVAFASTRTKLHVVVLPSADAVAPAEASWERLLTVPDQTPLRSRSVSAAIAATIRGTGVDVIDVGPAFYAIANAGRGPLFAAQRTELGPAGRTAVVDGVAQALKVAP